MRHLYLRYILAPLFMLQVRLVPLFVDYCYLYVMALQRLMHGKLLTPDYIEQVREALNKR